MDAAPHTPARLAEWLALGRHGSMDWMVETQARRAAPQGLWSEARGIVMLGLNYGPDEDPRPLLAQRAAGNVSVYARHRDYHDIVKGRLKHLAQWMMQGAPAGDELKVFVDTAPLMEKPLAAAAGLGWQGKHTNLVSREFGSWLFLGAIVTNFDMVADAPEIDRCGSCRACLDACPTQAFPAPYQLDARRCISYLTIEHKGAIDRDLRARMGNRIYGCDDCLAACPWNKFAQQAREMKLRARDDLRAPALAELARLDDANFRTFFSGSPVKRIGRTRFIRNVMIAIGNSGDSSLIATARAALDDEAPDVRAMAVWALSRLMDAAAFAALAKERGPKETDGDVRAEWCAMEGENA